VLLALTGYETLLLVVAGVFIVFALVCALVIPRSRPGFPGRGLGIFMAICALLFVAQLTAVMVDSYLGEEEAEAHEPTETEPTEPTETTGTAPAPGGEGDAAAGKEVFVGSAGCTGCHTLADAGATGAIGPNLDAAQPPYDLVVERVTNGQGGMPSFQDTLSEQQIQDVAAYVSSAAGS
jgi:mono/diheme cytochrome c family protein